MRTVFRLTTALLLTLLVSTTASAQLSVVFAARNRHPNLPGNQQVTVDALKEIAAQVGAGIYLKPSGNRCRDGATGKDYSCDFICYANGTGRDVFGDWENKASPQWPNPVPLDDTAHRCVLIGQPQEPPPSEPPPSNPPPSNPPPSNAELAARLDKVIELLTIVVAQQGGIRDELQAQTQAVVAATEQLRVQVAGGIRVKF